MVIFSSLRREQKEAVGLLSIGTFLEYFDLMLYVHMAVLLNELFFPKTDPFTASLLAAFAFCSTYILRPIGALIFGWIGDNIGRRSTVIITTFMMSLSCLVMAHLPTYSQIGVTAAWVVTICRITQGMSSMGEAIGAEIYLTEMTRPPLQYPIVALVPVFSATGALAALAIAFCVTSLHMNWRIVFLIGAAVALVGAIARKTLRETPDFADAKRRIQNAVKNPNENPKILNKSNIWLTKVNQKTAISFFLIECMWPTCFYCAYIHCGNILKDSFGFSAEQVIQQNFIVAIGQLLSNIIFAWLSYKIYPIRLIKVKIVLFFFVLWGFIFSLGSIITTSKELLILQLLMVTFFPTGFPASPIFYKHFPIFQRFTYGCSVYAVSRAFMYIVTSFGLVYAIKYFGHSGVLLIILPITAGFIFGLRHFEKLEKVMKLHPQRSSEALS